jgi:curved DNA-binding protein CbpA
MSTNPEYYSILSLPKSSSDADIKRAVSAEG